VPEAAGHHDRRPSPATLARPRGALRNLV